jgi:NADPH-dependent 2,4-dienoyl-CoA reductase/sulfur reductase-like enzyme/nitrite reductase/ring-hydroxylating ferredoxin subunit
VSSQSLADGASLAGHVGDSAVLLARSGDEFFAVGATCTHYGAPLADGLVVGDTLRCAWHHACFDLRSGDAVRAPALRPLGRWAVERRGDLVVVGRRIEPRDPDFGDGPRMRVAPTHRRPTSVLIIGGGAAGSAAAETLRREGYDGPVTLVEVDVDAPCDRPNLSKDYLAGAAPEEWIPLRSPDFYRDHAIDLRRDRTTQIDSKAKRAAFADGSIHDYDSLLIATGAEPVRLPPSVDAAGRVRYLRTLADSRAIIAASRGAGSAVVIGASFIGLEVAASLRARGIDVQVVAPETRPLERVLGPEVGAFIQQLHELHGVRFRLGQTVKTVAADDVTLANGERLAAALVVAGIGVRPAVGLAEEAGLTVDRGVVVDEYLESSVPGIFAAGDIARYPDRRLGESIRVEHWVVAQRQGQTAARNMLGAAERFDTVPFFWSSHYDVTIAYVGHAERWDDVVLSGNLEAHDCMVTYRSKGKALAVATVGRDRASLEAELAMERSNHPAFAAAGN